MKKFYAKKTTFKITILIISLVIIATTTLLYLKFFKFRADENNRYIYNTATAEYEFGGTKYTTTSNTSIVQIITGIAPPVVVIPHNTTYKPTFALKGTKSPSTSKIFVNNSSSGVVISNSTSWYKNVSLSIRKPLMFSVYSQDAYSNNSASVSVTITRYKLGDTNNDNIVNLKDLAYIASKWGQTVTSANYKADLNEDKIINSSDFNIVRTNWAK